MKWKGYDSNSSFLGHFRGDARQIAENWHGKHRQSFPLAASLRAQKHFLVLGCSFTYGTGIKPEDTFCWKMNEMQSDKLFHNRAMPGTGICTALLDLPYQLNNGSGYAAVIFATIANHVVRESEVRVVSDLESPDMVERGRRYYAHEAEYLIYLNGGLHRLWLFWFHRMWPFEESSRLVTFAHRVWQNEGADEIVPDVEDIKAVAGISSEENRFRYGIRAMYSYCKQRGLPFALVELFGFNSKRGNGNNIRYCSKPLEYFVNTPLTDKDVVPEIPIIKAEYPEDYMSRTELHTGISNEDAGDHPSALVHTYYAEKILAGVKELEKAGKL